VDEKGTVHFTDNPLSIPEKYRGKAEKRTTPTSRRPLTPSTTGKTEKPDRASAPERFIIPFTRDENAVIVEATINGTHRVEFILDTGASVTTIPIVKARDLGIDPAKGDPVLLQGVGGVTVASAVEIQSLNVGGAEVRPLQVALLGLRGRGLLGMDFLSDFKINIDHAQNQLTLEAEPGPHEGRSLHWWQQKFRFWRGYKVFVERVRAATTIQSTHDIADSILRVVEGKINDLELRASRAAVPFEFKK